jgi:hypothetical protein
LLKPHFLKIVCTEGLTIFRKWGFDKLICK